MSSIASSVEHIECDPLTVLVLYVLAAASDHSGCPVQLSQHNPVQTIPSSGKAVDRFDQTPRARWS
jgi:hypothetical protein